MVDVIAPASSVQEPAEKLVQPATEAVALANPKPRYGERAVYIRFRIDGADKVLSASLVRSS